MYTVERDAEGYVTIVDTDGYVVYAANADEYIIYKDPNLGLKVVQVKELDVRALLGVLACSVELFPDAD